MKKLFGLLPNMNKNNERKEIKMKPNNILMDAHFIYAKYIKIIHTNNKRYGRRSNMVRKNSFNYS